MILVLLTRVLALLFLFIVNKVDYHIRTNQGPNGLLSVLLFIYLFVIYTVSYCV